MADPFVSLMREDLGHTEVDCDRPDVNCHVTVSEISGRTVFNKIYPPDMVSYGHIKRYIMRENAASENAELILLDGSDRVDWAALVPPGRHQLTALWNQWDEQDWILRYRDSPAEAWNEMPGHFFTPALVMVAIENREPMRKILDKATFKMGTYHDPRMLLMVVRYSGDLLPLAANSALTPEIVLQAVTTTGNAIRHVPDHLITTQVLSAAYAQNPKSRNHIKKLATRGIVAAIDFLNTLSRTHVEKQS